MKHLHYGSFGSSELMNSAEKDNCNHESGKCAGDSMVMSVRPPAVARAGRRI